MKRLLAFLAVAAVVAGTAASSASAASDVRLTRCAFRDHGKAFVDSGTPVTLTQGWQDVNRGFVQDFLNAQKTTLSIDGGPVVDASSNWGPIDSTNTTLWTYATGRSLARGESMVVTFDITLSRQVSGTDEEGNIVQFGPGSVFGGPIQCTIRGK